MSWCSNKWIEPRMDNKTPITKHIMNALILDDQFKVIAESKFYSNRSNYRHQHSFEPCTYRWSFRVKYAKIHKVLTENIPVPLSSSQLSFPLKTFLNLSIFHQPVRKERTNLKILITSTQMLTQVFKGSKHVRGTYSESWKKTLPISTTELTDQQY